MRSELTELALIDNYLFRQLHQEETLAVETNIRVDETFAQKVETQRMAHRLIRLFARNKRRENLEIIYQRLLNEPAFANQLKSLL